MKRNYSPLSIISLCSALLFLSACKNNKTETVDKGATGVNKSANSVGDSFSSDYTDAKSLEQSKGKHVFLSKQDLEKAGVRNIRDYKYINGDGSLCERDDDLKCFYVWQFENGTLQSESVFDDYSKDTTQLHMTYYYRYGTSRSTKHLLSERHGEGGSGFRHEDEYKYFKNKLVRIEFYTHIRDYDENKEFIWWKGLEATDSFFYYKHGRLNYAIASGDELWHQYFSKENFSRYLNPEAMVPCMLVYVYDKEKLIGFISQKDQKRLGLTDRDFMKMRKEGFESYRSKIPADSLNKVIQSHYSDIDAFELTFDDFYSRDFLKQKFGVTGVKTLIIELADNYFLYYRFED